MTVSKALFAFENSGKLIHLDVKGVMDSLSSYFESLLFNFVSFCIVLLSFSFSFLYFIFVFGSSSYSVESADFERRSLAGRIRLAIRVDETTLLPTLHYEPLFELLAQNRLQALRLALPHVARENVHEFAEHLLKIFKKRGRIGCGNETVVIFFAVFVVVVFVFVFVVVIDVFVFVFVVVVVVFFCHYHCLNDVSFSLSRPRSPTPPTPRHL
jgi:hypothetical protein